MAAASLLVKGFLFHVAAFLSNGCVNGGRQAANVFDNALAARVLSPREAQGVCQMLGRARAVAAKLARVLLWAHGLARRERDVPVVVVGEVEEEMAVERHVLGLVAHQAPVVAPEFRVSVAARAELSLAKALGLQVILSLLLPPTCDSPSR